YGQRKDMAGTGRFDPTQMGTEAPGKFGREAVIGERGNMPGIRLGFGPYERRTVAGERQDGERPRRKEMFLGYAVVRAFMDHGGDDSALPVGPADRFDACPGADGGGAAVGTDEKPAPDVAAVGKLGQNV